MWKKHYTTDHLFPRTNIVIGMGSIFNIAGNYFNFNTSLSDEEADGKAIESDWGVVGLDIEKAMTNNPLKKLQSTIL